MIKSQVKTIKKILILPLILLIITSGKLNSFQRELPELMQQNEEESKTQYNPNANPYSASQDSAFAKALRLNIHLSTRFYYNLKYSELKWELQEEMSKGKPYDYALRELQKKYPDLLAPRAVDVVHQEIAIASALEVPFTTPYNPYGVKINMGDIGRFLGITADYTPTIQYNLDLNANVEVLVYSISASVIATLFDGKQSPGSYKISWNGRDEKGKKMPSGDYIMEVRVGDVQYIRKRVIIN